MKLYAIAACWLLGCSHDVATGQRCAAGDTRCGVRSPTSATGGDKNADAGARVIGGGGSGQAAIEGGEFSSAAHTGSAGVTVCVLDCEDAGACKLGAGPQTPESGHYEGSGTYVCDNDSADPNVTMLINTGDLSMDLAIDRDKPQQTGSLFFQWGLVVIAGRGDLDGTLDCGGAFRGKLVDGSWGLPGADPMSVIPTGGLAGDVTAQATATPGAIEGTLHWMSSVLDGSRGNDCLLTFSAQLKP